MDIQLIEKLRLINNEFYADNTESFSETRKNPWLGWERCAEHIAKRDISALSQENPFKVLDLAAGNLRFIKYLEDRFPDLAFDFYAIDNSDNLVPAHKRVNYQSLDILHALIKEENLSEIVDAPSCEVTASFGFMHHIPTQDLRAKVMDLLVDRCLPSGLVFISFWQFLSNPLIRSKIEAPHAKAVEKYNLSGLEENDFILGWKANDNVFRYCHNFSQADIDELVAHVSHKTELIDTFKADGKTNEMNSYVVLRAT